MCNFYFSRGWYTKVKTEVGNADLLVDTGAASTCLNIKELSHLLNVSTQRLLVSLSKIKPYPFRNIDNTPLFLYPLTLPKVAVGDRLFPLFYCFVSTNPEFSSVLGRDLLRCGITHLQFEDKGNCDPFDFEKYIMLHNNLPYGKLSFLDYSESEG